MVSLSATQRNILLTGATGSIGQALAKAYATAGVTLILQGRNVQQLEALSQTCEDLGARVVKSAFDLTDIEKLQAWVDEIDTKHPIDLLIVNQGININVGLNRQGETWPEIERLLEVNIKASLALVHAAVVGMRQRQRGQIALVSSLAAYFGLPDTPSYSASKAALKAFGEGMRGWLKHDHIGVTVVMPGYVDSAMCRAMPGPKPFLWQPEQAAAVIKRGLARNQARVCFPFWLNLGTWCLTALPTDWSLRILGWLGYRG